MEIIANWKIDEQYLQSYWRDWMGRRSKGRRWAVPIGGFFLLLGTTLMFTTSKNYYSIGALYIGCVELIWHFLDKRKWFRDRKEANNFGKEISIKFESDNIYAVGPYSKSEMSWQAIQAIFEAPDGLFLEMQKGISIYIPRKVIDREDGFKAIISMYDDANA